MSNYFPVTGLKNIIGAGSNIEPFQEDMSPLPNPGPRPKPKPKRERRTNQPDELLSDWNVFLAQPFHNNDGHHLRQ